ncbi:TonB-dependent receptor [Aureitalea sp. L0-47]|uniref:TonB-dependent receptor n=1 Tax=Aureitalea sp. L0-47 TaxID=2816962 RepID=UPI0022373942|nr:TonB-dependent receptor [Aureitalea sp. L0-47]
MLKDIFSKLFAMFLGSQSYSERLIRIVIVITLLLLCVTIASAQEDNLGTEVVNIVKPYTPSISDAFKVKETPVLNDSVNTTKKKVEYQIFSVPVASTFTPAKGQATSVEKAKPIRQYDNYATLGFGNYTSILAELYSNFQISRTDNAGFFLRHNSSQGGIDDVRIENKYYDTRLDGNYTSRQKDITYSADAGIEHQLVNWYGLPVYFDALSEEFINGIDAQQTYFGGYVGGSLALQDSFFEKATANLRFFTDSYSSSEFNFSAQPEFSFPLTQFILKVDGDVNYLSGSFDRGLFGTSGTSYSYLNAGVSPSLVYVDEDLTLSLGVAGYVGLDTENSESNFFIYPRIAASYRLVDELLIVYGGADGGLRQNTYYSFVEENPFVSPTLQIMPTSELYNAFGGLKGKLSNSVGYNVRASYGKEENKPLFQANPVIDVAPSEGYEYGNSFGLVYDDVNTLAVFGELKVEVNDSFALGINAEYFSYSMTNEPEAWNLPDLKATLFTNFDITDEIYAGASIFYVGERSILFTGDIGIFGDGMVEFRTLDSFIDANVHIGYRVNERLSIFAKGSNLVGENYERWQHFPVQGIQGLVGATYKFDWQ